MISTAGLDELMRRGWPARSELEVDGWIVRLSDGVTQRANSVLPAGAPADLHGTVVRTEELYAEHGLAPTFQISPAVRPANLDELLARRGYELQSPTIVQVAMIEEVLHQLPRSPLDIEVRSQPDTDWMNLWWAVDGREGSRARAIAYDIVTAGPALYASTYDTTGITAVGRLALVSRWAGVYCMAVRPDVRRRGHATMVLRGLLEHAAGHGARYMWLQVVADNEAARGFYERVGFVQLSSYHYRTLSSR